MVLPYSAVVTDKMAAVVVGGGVAVVGGGGCYIVGLLGQSFVNLGLVLNDVVVVVVGCGGDCCCGGDVAVGIVVGSCYCVMENMADYLVVDIDYCYC